MNRTDRTPRRRLHRDLMSELGRRVAREHEEGVNLDFTTPAAPVRASMPATAADVDAIGAQLAGALGGRGYPIPPEISTDPRLYIAAPHFLVRLRNDAPA